jgi:membrane protein insertase Oxa1/YidC/SpoIIIJ
MQIIGRVMPVAFGLISLNFATGLIVYFVTSNLWRIGQQQLVLNKLYEQEHPPLKTAESKEKAEKAERAATAEREAAAKPARTGPSKGGGSSNATPPTPRARPNPNTAQRRKKKRKR